LVIGESVEFAHLDSAPLRTGQGEERQEETSPYLGSLSFWVGLHVPRSAQDFSELVDSNPRPRGALAQTAQRGAADDLQQPGPKTVRRAWSRTALDSSDGEQERILYGVVSVGLILQ
jgi:hypothetical protein